MIPKSCMIPIKQIQTYIYFTLWGFLNLIAVSKRVFSFGPIVHPGSNQDHAVLRITRGPTGQRTIIHRLTYRERVIFGWTSPTPSSLAMPLVGLEQVICLRQPCQSSGAVATALPLEISGRKRNGWLTTLLMNLQWVLQWSDWGEKQSEGNTSIIKVLIPYMWSSGLRELFCQNMKPTWALLQYAILANQYV